MGSDEVQSHFEYNGRGVWECCPYGLHLLDADSIAKGKFGLEMHMQALCSRGWKAECHPCFVDGYRAEDAGFGQKRSSIDGHPADLKHTRDDPSQADDIDVREDVDADIRGTKGEVGSGGGEVRRRKYVLAERGGEVKN